MPPCSTDTTLRPASGPAKTTTPVAAESTGWPGTATRSTPRCPASQGSSGGSNVRRTRGAGSNGHRHSWGSAMRPGRREASEPVVGGAAPPRTPLAGVADRPGDPVVEDGERSARDCATGGPPCTASDGTCAPDAVPTPAIRADWAAVGGPADAGPRSPFAGAGPAQSRSRPTAATAGTTRDLLGRNRVRGIGPVHRRRSGPPGPARRAVHDGHSSRHVDR